MSKRIEELDWQQTPIGEISLRRRIEPTLQREVFEVKLGDEYLMSSLFTVAEIALASLGLAACSDPSDVVVGGLGLGYTARAVLDDPRVQSLQVIEALDAVISWHTGGLLPVNLMDPRCELVQGDFFALAGLGGLPECDALLVDIDHTPRHVLHPSHAGFYSEQGLAPVVDCLRPGGVFALWSDDPPDPDFLIVLEGCFSRVEAHLIAFDNPLTGGESSNSVYVARR